MQYMGLCLFNLQFSSEIIVRIVVLDLIIIPEYEVWTISHHVGLGHEIVVCSVCLEMFLRTQPCYHARYNKVHPFT